MCNSAQTHKIHDILYLAFVQETKVVTLSAKRALNPMDKIFAVALHAVNARMSDFCFIVPLSCHTLSLSLPSLPPIFICFSSEVTGQCMPIVHNHGSDMFSDIFIACFSNFYSFRMVCVQTSLSRN